MRDHGIYYIHYCCICNENSPGAAVEVRPSRDAAGTLTAAKEPVTSTACATIYAIVNSAFCNKSNTVHERLSMFLNAINRFASGLHASSCGAEDQHQKPSLLQHVIQQHVTERWHAHVSRVSAGPTQAITTTHLLRCITERQLYRSVATLK